MITKSQWAEFCSYVLRAKTLHMDPHMNGKRIHKIDPETHEIVTEQRIVYKHPDSFTDQSLDYLYRTITVRATLQQIINFSK